MSLFIYVVWLATFIGRLFRAVAIASLFAFKHFLNIFAF